jgi:hypothetical protein
MSRRVGRSVLLAGSLLTIAGSSWAQNTTFGNAVHLLVGQTAVRVTPATIAENRFYDAPVVLNRSYCAEATPSETELNPAVPTLAVFRLDQSTPLGTESSDREPKGLAASRVCFVAPATETIFIRLSSSSDAREYSLRFLETTLWTNWFFVGSDYRSYTLLRNTTNQPIIVDLRWRDGVGGEVVSLLNQTLAGNGIVYIDARMPLGCSMTVCATLNGSVEVAHTGSPEAIVGSQTTLSATTGLSFDTLLFQRRTW